MHPKVTATDAKNNFGARRRDSMTREALRLVPLTAAEALHQKRWPQITREVARARRSLAELGGKKAR